MARRETEQRRCVFCGQPGSSNEHVIPLWISRLFGDVTFKHETRDGQTYNADSINVKVNKVCADCNNGWMSDLEGAAQPLIGAMVLAQLVNLTPATARIVAAWIVKTAMMYEYVGWASGRGTRVSGPYFRDHERRRFMETQEPPDNVFIWLGTYVGDRMGSHVDGDLFVPPDSPSFGKGEGYVATFNIYYLAVQLFSVWRKRRDPAGSRSVLTLRPHKDWDTLLVRIWPEPSDIIVWPPPLSMNDEWLDALARRIDIK